MIKDRGYDRQAHVGYTWTDRRAVDRLPLSRQWRFALHRLFDFAPECRDETEPWEMCFKDVYRTKITEHCEDIHVDSHPGILHMTSGRSRLVRFIEVLDLLLCELYFDST